MSRNPKTSPTGAKWNSTIIRGSHGVRFSQQLRPMAVIWWLSWCDTRATSEYPQQRYINIAFLPLARHAAVASQGSFV